MPNTRMLVVLSTLTFGCGTEPPDPPAGDPALFPADYAAVYQEVRDCRDSIDHDLMRIRVLAAPDTVSNYLSRQSAFPEGAILLKEQFDGGDTDCSGPMTLITVMRKLAPGSGNLDWEWQRVDPATMRTVEEYRITRCVNCHSECVAPDGFDSTCAVP